MAAGKYDKAIIECRADITQYTIWHKSHTEPFVAAAPQPAQSMLDIDLKALSELVDVLMQCYSKTDAATFPAVLERLRGNVHHPRWQRKLTYFSAVQAYLVRRDPALAKTELGDQAGRVAQDTLTFDPSYTMMNGRSLMYPCRLPGFPSRKARSTC